MNKTSISQERGYDDVPSHSVAQIEKFVRAQLCLKEDEVIGDQPITLDSLDIVQLFVSIEDEFGVRFAEDQSLSEISSARDLVDAVSSLLASAYVDDVSVADPRARQGRD
jgi:acyl carrier protein